MAFWALAFGLAVAGNGPLPAATGDGTQVAMGAVALSLATLPVTFVVAGWVSRKPDWPIGVLAAMGLALAVGLPLMQFNNPVAALLSGTAAGAIVSLARPAGMGWHHRAIAAAIVTLLVIGGMQVEALFVVVALVGPALPFTAMGIADALARSGQVEVGADADASQDVQA